MRLIAPCMLQDDGADGRRSHEEQFSARMATFILCIRNGLYVCMICEEYLESSLQVAVQMIGPIVEGKITKEIITLGSIGWMLGNGVTVLGPGTCPTEQRMHPAVKRTSLASSNGGRRHFRR